MTDTEDLHGILKAESTAIEKVAMLAGEAVGVDIEWVKTPEEQTGLPKLVPLAKTRGKQPSFQSVAHLVEQYRLHPDKKRGTATVNTLASFIDLVNRHKTEHSVIFADTSWKSPSLTAVIDYHDVGPDGIARFGKHRIHYAFPLSDEWTAWLKGDGEPMAQQEFAFFIEDHIMELSSPELYEAQEFEDKFSTKVATPNELIQLSRGLQVNVESRVKNAQTLQSGEGQIVWEEAHKDSAGNTLKVPGLFMLRIAPFFMGEPARIPVRLRYRVRQGNLVWFYQIYRPDLHVTERVRSDLDLAAAGSGLPTFEGAPEMAA